MKKTSDTAQSAAQRKNALGKLLQFIIPVVVSVGLCVAMFRNIRFGDMVNVVRTDCNFRWIILMLAISIVPMVLRALRWGIQLRALGIKAPLGALILSIFGTYAVNIVFPRLGEVWRTGYIAYRQKAPFSEVFGSMIADRVADLFTVALLTLFTFVVARGPIIDFVQTYPAAYRAIAAILSSPLTWIVVAACIATAWWVLSRSRNAVVAKVRNFIKGLWEGFAALAKMKHKGLWLLLTACIWGCYFVQLVVAFEAFPLTSRLLHTHGIVVPLVCFILTSISMGIPSNGGIGPYQTTMLFALSLFIPADISQTEFTTIGAAFGNVIIASQTALLIVIGLLTFAAIAIDKRRGRREATPEDYRHQS